MTITQEDIARAERDPSRGRPAYSTLPPKGQPSDIMRDPVFMSANFRSLEPAHGWVHGAAFEPLRDALKAAGACRVEQHEIRTLGASLQMERSILNRDFTDWRD